MRALMWSALLFGLVAGSAQALDYVDSRGIRHWNHYGDRGATSSKEIVQNPNKPRVEIVQDSMRFVPVEPTANLEKEPTTNE
jgi:hypothetical protein